ncbi:hypothetical protein [Desulfurobacterium sp.]
MKIRLRIKHEVNMTPVYGQSYRNLVEKFLQTAEREVKALDGKKLSNRVFRNLFIERKRQLSRLKKSPYEIETLEDKKFIYDLFHSIFRNYRWALESGSEKEIEIKVWIASSIDKIERIPELLEKKVERN